jgi:hypothetical protein
VKASAWSERCVGRAPLSIPPGWQGLPIDAFVIPTQVERGQHYWSESMLQLAVADRVRNEAMSTAWVIGGPEPVWNFCVRGIAPQRSRLQSKVLFAAVAGGRVKQVNVELVPPALVHNAFGSLL